MGKSSSRVVVHGHMFDETGISIPIEIEIFDPDTIDRIQIGKIYTRGSVCAFEVTEFELGEKVDDG